MDVVPLLAHFSPESMAEVTGIDAETVREVARLYATSKGSMIFWGMGISQHVHGTDNSRCLIALSMITGQIGRPGTCRAGDDVDACNRRIMSDADDARAVARHLAPTFKSHQLLCNHIT